MTVKVFAPAKVNLALHITGQRDDGYHQLDTLVAFASVGDELTLRNGPALEMTVTGPAATGIPTDRSNLVMQAAALLDAGRGADIHLQKQLPVASGIGGGSADAAAALRGLQLLWDIDPVATDDVAALALGADVPMCLHPAPVRARGIGDQLQLVPNLPRLPVVLVNPRVPVSTPKVFAGLKSRNNRALPSVFPDWPDPIEFAAWLSDTGNDLQAPAVALRPEIAPVLESLASSDDALCVRMSGSGATCFAIYPDDTAAAIAATQLSEQRPDWWVAPAWLGDQRSRSKPRFS